MSINVAIDGPAGAGKSTISRRAAQALGFIYVDTGALYRTVGLNALRRGVDLEDPEAIAESVKGISVELKYENGEQAVFLNGENVSAFIRTPEASMAASKVSAVPAVREFLFGLQQDIAAKNDCVMDGRDRPSSKVFTRLKHRTGPKISCVPTLISSVTPSSIVGPT